MLPPLTVLHALDRTHSALTVQTEEPMNFYSQVILSFFHKDHTGWKMSVSCIRQAPYSLGVPDMTTADEGNSTSAEAHQGAWARNDHHAFSSVYRESTGNIQNSGDFNSKST